MIQLFLQSSVDELKRWFEANPKGDREMVFSLASSNGYIRTTSKMMSIDLANAKLAWIREAADVTDQASRAESDFLSYQSDDVVFADFHANRHTFITNLGKAGVSPKLAQSLARHSDIRLTFNIYTHVEMSEQTDAVGSLAGPRPSDSRPSDRERPENLPTVGPSAGPAEVETKQQGIDSAEATKLKNRTTRLRPKRISAGSKTDTTSPAADEKKSLAEDESEKAFAQQFAQGLHTGCHSTTFGGSDTPTIGVAWSLPQTLDLSGFSGDCQSMTDKKESSPGWARTTDTRINSPLLCQLSYKGI